MDLNVARRAAVRVNTTVRPVGAAVGRGSLLNNNVADNKGLDVQTAGLGVSLGVLKKAKQELDRLDGPATLGGLEVVDLGSAAYTTVEAAEGNGLLVLDHIVQVSVSLLELHAADGSSSLTRVLEVNTKIGATRLGSLLRQLGIVKRVASLSRVSPVLPQNLQCAQLTYSCTKQLSGSTM